MMRRSPSPKNPMSVAATTSSRPHKQLLYLIVGRFLKYAPEVDVALDLACGRMLIADKVRTRQYIGVDIDEDRLREGIARHPSALAISSTIESLPDDITGDMVFCLQCIAVNKFFKPEHTVEAVAKMVDATRPGGTLLFNVGYNSQAYLAEIVEMLGKVFSRCKIVDYGRFHGHWDGAALLLAYVMSALPFIARYPARPARIFICEGRASSPARDFWI